MTELKNFYTNPTDPNRNPIHVLRPNLPAEISKIGPLFQQVVKELLASGKLQEDGIVYSEYNDPATKTPETAWGVIRLYDGFGAFLWAFIYALYVFHTEMTIKRNNNHQEGLPPMDGINTGKLNEAMALMDYAMSLLNQWSPWDENLPNPAAYPLHKAKDIETVNALFLQAMNFIIGHELAHLEFDHTQADPQPELTSEEMEKQADARSVEFMQNGLTKEKEATIQIGLLAALCSLLLCSSKLQTAGYPDADDRIGAFIEQVTLSEDNDMWALAVLAFRLWDSHYQKELFFPQNMRSQKEVYYFLRSQLKGQVNVEHFSIDVNGKPHTVSRAKVDDAWQYQSKIDGITMHFKSNENNIIEGIINTQHMPKEAYAEACQKLTAYQLNNDNNGTHS